MLFKGSVTWLKRVAIDCLSTITVIWRVTKSNFIYVGTKTIVGVFSCFLLI